MGRAGGDKLVNDKRLYGRVRYDALSTKPAIQQLEILRGALADAGVRWPEKKASMLARNLARIEGMGGPAVEKKRLQACRGRDEKIGFMKSFFGIGDKYARDILMDAYHPDFRDSIAVDQRIKNISEALALEFGPYADAEQFYLSVAHAAGLTGWELDRLLFNFQEEVLARLGCTLARRGVRGTPAAQVGCGHLKRQSRQTRRPGG